MYNIYICLNWQKLTLILFLKYRNKWNKQDSQEFPIYSNKRSYVTRKYATFDDLHKKKQKMSVWMHAHRHILVFSNPPPLCEFWNITIIDVYLETPRPEIWNRTCPSPTHTICKICKFESFYHQGLLVQNHIEKFWLVISGLIEKTKGKKFATTSVGSCKVAALAHF